MTSEPFTVRIAARGYEADANGHVAVTVLLQYAQHARWECLRAAGIDQGGLLARGFGPVSLEEPPGDPPRRGGHGVVRVRLG